MKILVVSQFYYPDDFRINDIGSELVRQGHTVSVLTGLPDYTTSRIPQEYKWLKKRHEVVDGVKITRVPTVARRNGIIWRSINYLSFVLSSSFYALFSNGSFDSIFVYEVSPIFQALPAIVFKKRTKKKLVLYCCDLWPESMKAWGIQESNPVFKAVKWISGWIYRQCDIVAITSTPFHSYLTTVCGVDDRKIVYLPQHAEDDYADIACQYEDNDCIDFLFAGNIGSIQNVDCIINAIPYIKTDKNYCIHIVGDGSELENVKNLAKSLNVNEKTVFHGRYPVTEMKQFYKMADCFLLTFIGGGEYIGSTLPAKAQGYLCAGKPIIGAIDGAGMIMIRESKAGIVVPGGDYVSLAAEMRTMIENFDTYKQMGENGRKFYENKYTKEIFMKNLLDILQQ